MSGTDAFLRFSAHDAFWFLDRFSHDIFFVRVECWLKQQTCFFFLLRGRIKCTESQIVAKRLSKHKQSDKFSPQRKFMKYIYCIKFSNRKTRQTKQTAWNIVTFGEFFLQKYYFYIFWGYVEWFYVVCFNLRLFVVFTLRIVVGCWIKWNKFNINRHWNISVETYYDIKQYRMKLRLRNRAKK